LLAAVKIDVALRTLTLEVDIGGKCHSTVETS
jgi:hypothetical protein